MPLTSEAPDLQINNAAPLNQINPAIVFDPQSNLDEADRLSPLPWGTNEEENLTGIVDEWFGDLFQ